MKDDIKMRFDTTILQYMYTEDRLSPQQRPAEQQDGRAGSVLGFAMNFLKKKCFDGESRELRALSSRVSSFQFPFRFGICLLG